MPYPCHLGAYIYLRPFFNGKAQGLARYKQNLCTEKGATVPYKPHPEVPADLTFISSLWRNSPLLLRGQTPHTLLAHAQHPQSHFYLSFSPHCLILPM